MQNLKNTNRPKSKKPIVIGGIILLVIVAGGLGFLYFQNRNTAQTDSLASTPDPIETRETESEDSSFPVPADTPQDAIKDYELVAENEMYKIRRDKNSDQYVITLYAIINRPDQYDAYLDQLRQYKQEALAYLSDQGLDPTTLTITYEPDEAKDL